mmetsp:Transcript_13729/g.19634  ORF Transcript_13729/g.19634 Transcript_13729/m.19634 type:complete len:93 (-) Transcript_13729:1365-1643(-)
MNFFSILENVKKSHSIESKSKSENISKPSRLFVLMGHVHPKKKAAKKILITNDTQSEWSSHHHSTSMDKGATTGFLTITPHLQHHDWSCRYQ